MLQQYLSVSVRPMTARLKTLALLPLLLLCAACSGEVLNPAGDVARQQRDIIYISTQGGPGNSTMVPGLEIFYLAFTQREVGQASALAVVLMVVVLLCVLPIQWLTKERD